MRADPKEIYRTGPNEAGGAVDPLTPLKAKLEEYKAIKVPGAPPLTGTLRTVTSRFKRSAKLTRRDETGGAIGYVGYDCIRYFEPKTARDDLVDPLGIPESVFMLHDSLVAFDHLFQRVYVVSHIYLPSSATSVTKESITESYHLAAEQIKSVADKLSSTGPLPQVNQPRIDLSANPVPKDETPEERYLRLDKMSNVGREGYERFVTSLKESIVQGEIIQAVPSQRLRRETKLHPFNVYR